MKEVVIVSAARTPVGNFGGAYRDMNATQLGAVVAKAALERAGITPADVDEVIFGSGGMPIKEANLARQVALFAGVPYETPAYSVQRNCASGAQALASAVQGIRSGDGEAYLVGGSEHMSGAPYMLFGARWGLKLRHTEMEDSLWSGLTDQYTQLLMGETAERLADMYGISRLEQDQLAVESHTKAFKAARMGKFKDEIVPVQVPKKRGEPETVVQDEGPMAGLSLERLALAPTMFRKDGTVTPGNSCPINDGAAACVVMSEAKARELGKKPLAHVRSYGFAGCDPKIMGIGPVYSTKAALRRAGLQIKDIQLVEFNEAFAAQYLACEKEMGLDRSIVNVNGGAIALGHPIGATGLRLLTTLVHEMGRRDLRYGMISMCVGGGQGATVILERP